LALNNVVTLKIWVKGNSTTWKLGYSFLFAFHSNYGCILYRFGDKARYWSKIAIFFIPLLHSTPPWYEKLTWYGYWWRKKFEDTCNRLDRIPACDRQTDRQIDILRQRCPRYAYALRGNKENMFLCCSLLVAIYRARIVDVTRSLEMRTVFKTRGSAVAERPRDCICL